MRIVVMITMVEGVLLLVDNNFLNDVNGGIIRALLLKMVMLMIIILQ